MQLSFGLPLLVQPFGNRRFYALQSPRSTTQARLTLQRFNSWHFLGHFKAYPGFIALCINVAVVLVLTLVFMLLRVPKGADATTPDDFEEEAALPLPEPVGISAVVGDPGKVRPAAGRS